MAKVTNPNNKCEEMVKVYIPRVRKDQPDKVVFINERQFTIPINKWVDVPEIVAEVLDNARIMRDRSDAFQQQLIEEYERKAKEV